MHPTLPLPLRTAALIAGSAMIFSALHGADAAKPAPDTDPLDVSFENSFTLAGQYASTHGDKAAFQAENWTAKNGFAGLEDFRYSKDLKNDVSVQADGHALVGNEDYLAHVKVSKSEFGSVDVGYKRFRTFYDGIGGFFPANEAWLPLTDRELHVDRSKFWAEANLTLPKAPVVTIRYTNELRNGMKDSTIWGDTDSTFNPAAGTAGAYQNRKIVASYITLDERHQSLEASAKHTIGRTTVTASVNGAKIDNNDARYLNKYPGETRPTSGTLQWWQMNNAISGFDRQLNTSKALTFSAKAETILTDKVTVFGGASYQHANTDFSGDRVLTTTITTAGGVVRVPGGYTTAMVRAPGAYTNLLGGSKTEILVANIGADLRPLPNLFIETALKYEDRYAKADSSYIYLGRLVNQTTGAITNNDRLYAGSSKLDETALIPELSVRYNGIRNLSLYASADYRHSPGTEDRRYITTSTLVSNFDVTENHGNYKIGANWVPTSFLTLRAETFYRDHRNSFNGYAVSDGGLYLLGTEYKGARLTAVIKPLPTVSLTSRYVYKTGTGDVTTDTTATYQSMDLKSHEFGETIDWTPVKQFYMQGNLNVVFDTLSTAYPRAGYTTPGSGNDVIRDADNNYVTASVIAGFVVDKLTNAEVQYTYYRADNYQRELVWTVPYGAGAKNYTATLGVKRKITDTLVANAKIGYISSRNDTTGGRTDYDARVAYVSLQQAF